MKVTVRKVRGQDAYVVKDDGKLVNTFQTKKEADEFYNDYLNKSKLNLQVEEKEVELQVKPTDTTVEIPKGVNGSAELPKELPKKKVIRVKKTN